MTTLATASYRAMRSMVPPFNGGDAYVRSATLAGLGELAVLFILAACWAMPQPEDG